MKRLFILMACVIFLRCGYTQAAGMSESETGKDGVHEYVDLGLSSGTMWATCNIGASAPNEPGYLFAWGMTEPGVNFTWDTYRYYEGTVEIEDGNLLHIVSQIGDNISGTRYDAASDIWGNGWRMPECSDFYELISQCSTEWVGDREQCGVYVYGPNGNHIFLPVNFGPEEGIGPSVLSGNYWSGSAVDVELTPGQYFDPASSAMSLSFFNSQLTCVSSPRCSGMNIRPVVEKGTVNVTGLQAMNDKLMYEAGCVYFNNMPKGCHIEVSDIAGRTMLSVPAIRKLNLKSIIPSGVYLVRLLRGGLMVDKLKIRL